jgi:SWI/SNF-related matrix-associated actin-dependent regulator of chromatin subfamily A member 5
MIKNEAAQISKVARKIRCMSSVLLTGTPLQNNLHELWAILNFLFPEIFPVQSAHKFDECFDLGNGKVDCEMLSKAHYMLRPFMLRRVKSEVENKLPPKYETKIYCPLSSMQVSDSAVVQ